MKALEFSLKDVWDVADRSLHALVQKGEELIVWNFMSGKKYEIKHPDGVDPKRLKAAKFVTKIDAIGCLIYSLKVGKNETLKVFNLGDDGFL